MRSKLTGFLLLVAFGLWHLSGASQNDIIPEPLYRADNVLQIQYMNNLAGKFELNEEGVRGLSALSSWRQRSMQVCPPPAGGIRDCNLFLHYGTLTAAKTAAEFKEAMRQVQSSGWPDRFYLTEMEVKFLREMIEETKRNRQKPDRAPPPEKAVSESPTRPSEEASLISWINSHYLPEQPLTSEGQILPGSQINVAVFAYGSCEKANSLADDANKRADADLFIVLLPDASCLPSSGRAVTATGNPYHAFADQPGGFRSRTIFLYPARANRFFRDISGSYRCGSLPREACRLRLHFHGHNLIGIENSFEPFRDQDRNHPLFMRDTAQEGQVNSQQEQDPHRL